MSRIYFHTRTHTAELRGSERGWLRHIASTTARGLWGLDTIDPLDRAVQIADMIVPGGPGQYVRDRAIAVGYLSDSHRLSTMCMTGNHTTMIKDYAQQAIDDRNDYQDMWRRHEATGDNPARHVRHNPNARNALVDILDTCLRVTDVPLRIGDHVVSSANIELNTALAVGNEAVCLAAKIHGWCEIHPWIEEHDRAWFADVIEWAVACGIYRDGIWYTGLTGDPTQRQRVRQGWDDVTTLLRDRAGHPGPVVMSYSVCDEFPNPEVSTLMPPWPADVTPNWDALTPDQQTERREARSTWYALDTAQRWDTAMDGIRASQPWANITPDNLSTATFGPDISLLDVFHPEHVERVRVAFEGNATAD